MECFCEDGRNCTRHVNRVNNCEKHVGHLCNWPCSLDGCENYIEPGTASLIIASRILIYTKYINNFIFFPDGLHRV